MRLTQILRYLREKLFLAAIRNDAAFSPSTKVSQIQLFNMYQNMARDGRQLPSIFDVGFRVYSQFEEDGMILFLLAVLGMKTKYFVDIGSGNCINSNCANLAINHGFHGLFIDGNEKRILTGQTFYANHPDTSSYPPKFVCNMVKRENINELILSAGFKGEVDFLSIDIDGNDYWVWEALDIITPRIVMIETHIEFGFRNIVVPYDPSYVYPGKHPIYHGASVSAMNDLAKRKGYRLVGANRFGFNTIYIREGEAINSIPNVSVEKVLEHPRNNERFKLFEPIKDWEYITF
jgi:hypothetical protein